MFVTPDWMPSGTDRIAGDIEDGNRRRLFVADTLSDKIRLFESGFYDILPRWGPQGWILFSRSDRWESPGPNQFGTIFTLHSETGELRKWLGPESIPGAKGVDAPDY